MFLTNVLLKKARTRSVLVLVKSLASGHNRTVVRERSADKVEFIFFDPYVRKNVLYRETKKLKSV